MKDFRDWKGHTGREINKWWRCSSDEGLCVCVHERERERERERKIY